MTLEWIERIIRWTGALTGLAVLAVILTGLSRGLRQPAGRTTGKTRWMRSPAFYIIVSLLYFALCALIWRPIGISIMPSARIAFLAAGGMVFFAGLSLILWSRITLGRYYFGSTTGSAQLFEHHKLITTGPFAFLRHPMYLGYLLTGLGGILLFQTWTMVFFTLNFPALMLRARREEQVLAAEFGQDWQDYSRRVPGWLPRFSRRSLHPGAAALIEVGFLFLPALPAYLWFWPNASGRLAEIGQIAAYIYFGAGALVIGRRWPLDRLGINRRGIWLGLACGLALVIARALVLLGVIRPLGPPDLSLGSLIAQIAYYIGLVGLVEELLFRGLIYRALEDWRGTPWAIWISSLVFGLWHFFGQGWLVGVATIFYGLIFALMRRRAGGIIGLIFAHGFMDLATLLLISPAALQELTASRPSLIHPLWVLTGVVILLGLPLYLWKIHPLWQEDAP